MGVVDVNGDGRTDLVFGPTDDGHVYVLQSAGSAFVDNGPWLSGLTAGLAP